MTQRRARCWGRRGRRRSRGDVASQEERRSGCCFIGRAEKGKLLTESEKKKKMRHGRKWGSCVTEGKEKMLLHTKRWKQELLSRERKSRKRYLASQHAQNRESYVSERRDRNAYVSSLKEQNLQILHRQKTEIRILRHRKKRIYDLSALHQKMAVLYHRKQSPNQMK